MSADRDVSARPRLPPTRRRPSPAGVMVARCGQCGYVLDGLADLGELAVDEGAAPTLCPECAQPFNPFSPYRPLSRGQWATFLAIVCAPQASLLALGWAMSLVPGESVRAAIGVVAPMWAGLLLYAVLVWPGLWGSLVGKERVPRERSQLMLRAYLCALTPLAILVLTMIS